MNRIREVLLVVFFSLQAVGIIGARFTEERFFAWAPYDQLTRYSIEVTEAGSQFTSSQIEQRYRVPAVGRENRSIHNLFRLITTIESDQDSTVERIIVIHYSINGGQVKQWVLEINRNSDAT